LLLGADDERGTKRNEEKYLLQDSEPLLDPSNDGPSQILQLVMRQKRNSVSLSISIGEIPSAVAPTSSAS
jgi:hypothetical protein